VIGWVIKTLSFPLVETLRDENWTVMHAMAQEFAEKSGGFFCGAFGSLDGLAARMSSGQAQGSVMHQTPATIAAEKDSMPSTSRPFVTSTRGFFGLRR